MNRGIFFPGQGSQVVGMAVDLVEGFPEARRVFDRGREILGWDVLAVCRDGPEPELSATRVSQPAIFLHSMACLEVLGKLVGSAEPFGRAWAAFATAGLSLGEYSALVFAGSIEFEDAVRIVGLRGAFMQEACAGARGGMAAVLGCPAEKVEEVVTAARGEGLSVGVANYNSPDQTVVSGEAEAVQEVAGRLEAAGAKRVMRLNVAGAFHSPLMAPATRKLEPHLQSLAIRAPRIPFYSNVTGDRVEDPQAIRRGLIAQIESSVRWKHIELAVVKAGMKAGLELGPGRVVQGLFRSVDRKLDFISAGTASDLVKLGEAIVGSGKGGGP